MVLPVRFLTTAGLTGSRRNARSAARSLADDRREREAVEDFLEGEPPDDVANDATAVPARA